MVGNAVLKSTMGFSDGEAAAIANCESILAAIRNDSVHLALWDRPRPARLKPVDDLSWDPIDDIDRSMDVADCGQLIPGALIEAGYPARIGQLLGEETLGLTRIFAEIMACDRIRLRLEIVETDACRKFHADMVTARLLMTVSGPATQWIYADEPDNIFDMKTGAVGVFKGRLSAEVPHILHRSPPIATAGATRLLLVINPVEPDDIASTSTGSRQTSP